MSDSNQFKNVTGVIDPQTTILGKVFREMVIIAVCLVPVFYSAVSSHQSASWAPAAQNLFIFFSKSHAPPPAVCSTVLHPLMCLMFSALLCLISTWSPGISSSVSSSVKSTLTFSDWVKWFSPHVSLALSINPLVALSTGLKLPFYFSALHVRNKLLESRDCMLFTLFSVCRMDA